jgi:hypothetical protein
MRQSLAARVGYSPEILAQRRALLIEGAGGFFSN